MPAQHVVLSVYALALTLIFIPLIVIDIPMIADYPNHVARMHILGNVNDEILLSQRYRVHFDFIPNIAMDFTVPWLTKLIPLDIAGRLFLALTLFSTLASTSFLHRILFNHWSLWPLIASLFAYHGSFIAGMVNFSLGIGLVPAALAVWIMMRHATTTRRLMIGSATALGLFFCHLTAFGMYGLLVIGYEWVRARDKWSRRDGPRQATKDFMIAGATGLIPVLLFSRQLLDPDVSGVVDNGLSSEALSWEALSWGALSWGTWSWKAKALLAPLANYHLTVDLASFALLAGLAFIGWRSGRLVIERRMAPGLGLLALGFALAPKAFWTGGVFDQRFVILLALMFIGSSRFETNNGKLRYGLAAVLAGLFLVRLGIITTTWIDHRADLQEMRSAFEPIEKGASILVVQPDKTAGVRLAPPRHMVFHHGAQMASLATLAVIEKSALVSTLYAIPGQQPISIRASYSGLAGQGAAVVPTLADLTVAIEQNDPEVGSQLSEWWQKFDYVLLIYGYGPGANDLRGNLPLKTLLDGEIVDLFQIIDG